MEDAREILHHHDKPVRPWRLVRHPAMEDAWSEEVFADRATAVQALADHAAFVTTHNGAGGRGGLSESGTSFRWYNPALSRAWVEPGCRICGESTVVAVDYCREHITYLGGRLRSLSAETLAAALQPREHYLLDKVPGALGGAVPLELIAAVLGDELPPLGRRRCSPAIDGGQPGWSDAAHRLGDRLRRMSRADAAKALHDLAALLMTTETDWGEVAHAIRYLEHDEARFPAAELATENPGLEIAYC